MEKQILTNLYFSISANLNQEKFSLRRKKDGNGCFQHLQKCRYGTELMRVKVRKQKRKVFDNNRRTYKGLGIIRLSRGIRTGSKEKESGL